MCYVYRLAYRLDWTQATIDAWESGDQFILQLVEIALSVTALQADDGQSAAPSLRPTVLAMSDRFTAAQRRFSDRIGERTRWVAHVSMLVIGLFACLLAAVAATATLRLQRKEAESRSQLEAAHQRLSLATQSDRLGIFEWKVGCDRMLLDARCCELYGLPHTGDITPINRSVLWTRVPPEDHSDIEAVIERAAQQRSMFKHRYRVVPASTQVRHVEITGIFTKTLGALHMTGVIRDVTQEVALTDAEAHAHAERMSAQTRAQLLSRLNHELRTPLNAILGFAQLLLVNLREMNSQQRSWIEEIDKAGRGQLSMIDDVLRISLLAGGGLPYQKMSVDLRRVLRNVGASIGEVHRSRLVIEVPSAQGPADETVQADPERLHEALKRLVDHALQLTPREHRVFITTVASEDFVEVHLAARGWEIRRRDSGPLLTETPAPQLGFSLALVEALLHRMDGSLEIVPQQSGGVLIVTRLVSASDFSQRERLAIPP